MMTTCSTPQCVNPVHSKGQCAKCYGRAYHRATYQPRPRKSRKLLNCEARGCDATAKTKHLCPKHYSRLRKFGTIESPGCRYCGDAVSHGRAATCGAEACRAMLERDWNRAHYIRVHGQKDHACTGCGKPLRAAWRSDPRCRECGSLTLDPAALASRARRRTCERRAAKAANGTTGKRVWTQGSCGWCGEEFLRVGTAPARWCSDKCKRKVTQRRRCTAIHGGTGWTWSDFMRMARKFNYCCAYCGDKPDRLDPDHVIPLARGGTDSLSNILPTCMPCNSDKRDLLPTEWNADRARRGLEPRHTDFISPQFFHLALPSTAAA